MWKMRAWSKTTRSHVTQVSIIDWSTPYSFAWVHQVDDLGHYGYELDWRRNRCRELGTTLNGAADYREFPLTRVKSVVTSNAADFTMSGHLQRRLPRRSRRIAAAHGYATWAGRSLAPSNESAAFEVFTISQTVAALTTTGGLRLVPEFDFACAPQIYLLIIPGGFGTRRLLENAQVLQWIQTVALQAKQVASVCIGALLLAKAGLLTGHRATTHWASLDLLASFDPTITVDRDQRFVNDGIITAAWVAAGIDMAFAIVESMCGPSVANETAHYIEYQRNAWTPMVRCHPLRCDFLRYLSSLRNSTPVP